MQQRTLKTTISRRITRATTLAVLLFIVMGSVSYGAGAPAPIPPWQSKVDSWVLETADTGKTEFLVFLSEQANLGEAARLPKKTEKGKHVYAALTTTAERTQAPLLRELKRRGLEYRPFWIANMIWVRGDMADVQALALRGDVAHIYANPTVHVDEPIAEPAYAAGPQAAAQPDAIEWNITKVDAPEVWAAGFTGQGVVIGGQDTGYQWDHPALKGKYRGWNGTAASHDYNWHDAIHTTTHGSSCGANSPAPCDDYGHGTHTMGTMVGRRWRGQSDRHGAGRAVDRLPQYGQWLGHAGHLRRMLPVVYRADHGRWQSARPDEGARCDQQLVGMPAQRRLHRPQRPARRRASRACGRHRHRPLRGQQRLGVRHRVDDPAAIYAESFTVGATEQRRRTTSPASPAAAR